MSPFPRQSRIARLICRCCACGRFPRHANFTPGILVEHSSAAAQTCTDVDLDTLSAPAQASIWLLINGAVYERIGAAVGEVLSRIAVCVGCVQLPPVLVEVAAQIKPAEPLL